MPTQILAAFAALLLPALFVFSKRSALPGLLLYWPVFAFFWIKSFDQLSVLSQPGITLMFVVSAALGAILLARDPRAVRSLGWMTAAGALGCVIAVMSGGSGNADPMLQAFLKWGLDQEQAEFATHLVRKLIHFTFYGSIALFAARAYLVDRRNTIWAATFGFLWAIPHAIVDEWRQGFEARRSGSIWDVLLDVCGMMVFLSILMMRVEKKTCDT